MLNRETVEAKLGALVNTGPSIQTTGAWVLFHRRRMAEVNRIDQRRAGERAPLEKEKREKKKSP
jgi:hypothetical protein